MPSTATDRLQGLTTSVAVKAPCKAVSASTLALAGEQTVSGIACVDGDRVLYAPSVGSVSSGIYVVSTGTWQRAKDFDGARDVVSGTMILVGEQLWVVKTSGEIVIDTTSILIEPIDVSLGFVSDLSFMTEAQIADVKAGTKLYDHAYAMDAALASGYPVHVPHGPGWLRNYAHTVVVPSNSKIYGHRPRIFVASGVNNHAFRIANGATNVAIEGLSIDGNRAGNTGGNGIAMGGTGGNNIRIKDCFITGCSANGIYVAGTTVYGIQVTENFVTDCYSAGISASDTTRSFAFNDNLTWLNGTHGVGVIGIAIHGTMNDNVSWDNGWNSPNADNLTGYNILNDDWVVCGNISYGGGNNGIHVGGTRLVVSSNTAYGATFYGIAVRPNAGAGDDCSVSSNVSYNNGISGFWLENCNGGSVIGNVSRGNAAHGFAFDNCAYVSFVGNTARNNGGDGFRNGTPSAWLTFTGNTSRSNGGDGIELADVTLSVLTGNVFAANTGWGFNRSGAEGANILAINIIQDNLAGQIAQPSLSTRVEGNETGESVSIASAATLTLPPNGDYFLVTGTTNIGTLSPGFRGRRVTLEFAGILTVANGGNKYMSAAFVTAAKYAISYVCNASNVWVEQGRSANV